MSTQRKFNNRKIVHENINDVSPSELEGRLIDLRDMLNSWIEKYGPTARLNWDPNFHYDYESTPSSRFNILRDREETDTELEARLDKEKKYKEAIDERERTELARLQQKYGKET